LTEAGGRAPCQRLRLGPADALTHRQITGLLNLSLDHLGHLSAMRGLPVPLDRTEPHRTGAAVAASIGSGVGSVEGAGVQQ
jgi:hypothetical protein